MRKFFYDYYTNEDICGMYTFPHFIVIALFIIGLLVALYFSRRLTDKGVDKLHFWIAVGVTVAEVIKISLRLYKKQNANDWMPLFYCSLFLFAVWLARSKREPIRRMGYAYLTMGGILAATFYIFYPSTGLGMYPIWHPAALHGIVYHFLMAYTGWLLLIKKRYVPKAKDALYYFIFTFAACIPAYFFNKWLGCNCMFLAEAFGLPILSDILAVSPVAYMAIVVVAQTVLMFWFNYGLYKLVIYCKEKKKENRKA